MENVVRLEVSWCDLQQVKSQEERDEDMVVVEISQEVDSRDEVMFSEMSILTTPRAEDQLA